MRVVFTKISDRVHRLEVTGRDGPDERVELETRSLLLHDLVHYAVESEAPIRDGFYGLLAEGVALSALNDREAPYSSPGLATAESLVGPMQSLCQGRLPQGPPPSVGR